MIERLPTPWGLVRSGVAPDHPKIKSVTRVYEKTAAHPRFRFFGNVELRRRTSRARSCSPTTTRSSTRPARPPTGRSASPAKTCPGSHAATEFVGWYNGHPDHADLEVRPALGRARRRDRQRQRRARRRAHARARPRRARPHRHRRPRARGARRSHRPRGRRRRSPRARAGGLHQPRAARARRARRRRRDRRPRRARARARRATTAGRRARPDRRAQRRDPARLRRAPRRAGKPKRIVLRFLLSPIELHRRRRAAISPPSSSSATSSSPATTAACARSATDEHETIAAGLVFRAIGYRGMPLPGVPFDERAATSSPTTAGA